MVGSCQVEVEVAELGFSQVAVEGEERLPKVQTPGEPGKETVLRRVQAEEAYSEVVLAAGGYKTVVDEGVDDPGSCWKKAEGHLGILLKREDLPGILPKKVGLHDSHQTKVDLGPAVDLVGGHRNLGYCQEREMLCLVDQAGSLFVEDHRNLAGRHGEQEKPYSALLEDHRSLMNPHRSADRLAQEEDRGGPRNHRIGSVEVAPVVPHSLPLVAEEEAQAVPHNLLREGPYLDDLEVAAYL